jgi:hypothetical protein
LLAGIAAVAGAVGGVTSRRAWLPVDEKRSSLFTISLDVQLLLGIILYALLSPVTRSGFENVGLTMRDPVLRFFVVEHLVGMVVAVALAHVGRARVRKATDAAARHRSVLVFGGLALAVILLSIPWPGMPAGRVLFRGL